MRIELARPEDVETVILVRTNYFDERLLNFSERLRHETGIIVHVLADETNQRISTGDMPKIVITRNICRKLGLFCPGDFGWRCGDYGFYVARRALPSVRFFWMIEPDTRPNVLDYGQIFDLFREETADFIAPHLREPGPTDFWYPTMRWFTPNVWRCFFGFSRMSAQAADVCLQERRRFSRRPEARLMWPNDETFVASLIKLRGLTGKDLNAVRAGLCTVESFGFHTVKKGDDLDALQPDGMIYHPVLYGSRFDQKAARLRAIEKGSAMTMAKRSELARLKMLRGWAKLRSGRIPGLSSGRSS